MPLRMSVIPAAGGSVLVQVARSLRYSEHGANLALLNFTTQPAGGTGKSQLKENLNGYRLLNRLWCYQHHCRRVAVTRKTSPLMHEVRDNLMIQNNAAHRAIACEAL
jgi:hypothetical protein